MVKRLQSWAPTGHWSREMWRGFRQLALSYTPAWRIMDQMENQWKIWHFIQCTLQSALHQGFWFHYYEDILLSWGRRAPAEETDPSWILFIAQPVPGMTPTKWGGIPPPPIHSVSEGEIHLWFSKRKTEKYLARLHQGPSGSLHFLRGLQKQKKKNHTSNYIHSTITSRQNRLCFGQIMWLAQQSHFTKQIKLVRVDHGGVSLRWASKI